MQKNYSIVLYTLHKLLYFLTWYLNLMFIKNDYLQNMFASYCLNKVYSLLCGGKLIKKYYIDIKIPNHCHLRILYTY